MENVAAKEKNSEPGDLPSQVGGTLVCFDTAAYSCQHMLKVKQRELKGLFQM